MNNKRSVCPVPSALYKISENGEFHLTEEMEAIKKTVFPNNDIPRERIENLTGQEDAEERVAELAQAHACEPFAGLMAAIANDESYLEFKGVSLHDERKSLEAERDAMPHDTLERDPDAGWRSMTRLERVSLPTIILGLCLLAAWTAVSDLTLLYGYLSVASPLETETIDFAALHAGGAQDFPEPQATPLYLDTNFWKSIAIFSPMFVVAAILDVLKVAPLSMLEPMPPGIRRKFRWLFTRQGLRVAAQVVLMASAIAFNYRIGFELDLAPSDINAKPPISSALTNSLVAFALAFSVYAYLHWAVLVLERLRGVCRVPNPHRIEMESRIAILDAALSSLNSVLSTFKGIAKQYTESEKKFVLDCLSVLAGIQGEQKRASDFLEAASGQAAAQRRMEILSPSRN